MEDATRRAGANGRQTPLALVAAGGEGKRLGSIGPKALVTCAGRPLLAWCLDAFAQSRAYGAGAGLVVVAGHASELPAFEAVADQARSAGLRVSVAAGGPSRSHSVAAALHAGIDEIGSPPQAVLVQDAARIFTTPTLVDALYDTVAAVSYVGDGVVAARRVTDTIKLVDDHGVVRETPPRERLWAVQTPQAFRSAPLIEALAADDATLAAASDDASLIEARGGRVTVFEWTEPNPKITTPEDLATAGELLS